MANNQLTTVRNQFKTRGYTVSDIHRSVGNLEKFEVESGPNPKLTGLPVSFQPDFTANPSGQLWAASEIHWWTAKHEYSGQAAESHVEVTDRIIKTAEQDNGATLAQ
ncbi:hypothetical protein [Mycobacterium sp. AT1]|uniref:hypothetical protein n=1 Tax=Mycobacterium sp. AT1 TaxID=1961706 RepID=UPI0011539D48|nr:hypothetical protein [Mycobacterium sp. AT1]